MQAIKDGDSSKVGKGRGKKGGGSGGARGGGGEPDQLDEYFNAFGEDEEGDGDYMPGQEDSGGWGGGRRRGGWADPCRNGGRPWRARLHARAAGPPTPPPLTNTHLVV